MNRLLSHLDRGTRAFWRVTGRPVDLTGAQRWLDAPMHDSMTVGDTWLDSAALAHGGTLRPDTPDGGIVARMSDLDGPQFRAGQLRPQIRDFYQHTSLWRMEVWTQWNALFQPGGELITRLFGRRTQQLALPTRPLDVARGMDSRVIPIMDADGRQVAAGWIRTLRATGEVVFSGHYSTRLLPDSEQPSVHVTFPLQAGNVQVFLRPRVTADGGFELSSPAGAFGQDGAYVVVRHAGGAHAARVPIHETFLMYVDTEGVLRTDHELRLWRATVTRLHYKITPTPA